MNKAKLVCLIGLLAFLPMIFGCATPYPQGVIFTELSLPVDAAGPAKTFAKTGEANCTCVLALVATGDCSIDAAMKDGGITKVHHVDWEARNILGIIGEYKLIVYGE